MKRFLRKVKSLSILNFVIINLASASTLMLSFIHQGQTQTINTTFDFTNGYVNEVVTDDNFVYIGGKFQSIINDSHYTGSGALVNGTTGLADYTLSPVVDGIVNTVISDGAGGWYLGGNFSGVSNGTTTSLREGLAHILPDGTLDPSFIFNANDNVACLLRVGTDLYVGGEFTTINGIARLYIAKIDLNTNQLDNNFNPVPDNAVLAMATDGVSLYIGGSFNTIGAQPIPKLAKVALSDGGLSTSWVPITVGSGSVIKTMALDGSGSLYVGGFFINLDVGGVIRSHVAKINTSDGTGDSGFQADTDFEVEALLFDGTGLFLAGQFTMVQGMPRNYLAKVNSTTGAPDASWDPNPDNVVYALGLDPSDGNLVVAGDFTVIANAPRGNAAKINPVTGNLLPWNPITDDIVESIAIDNDNIYLGGRFKFVGGTPRNNLARFDKNTGTLDAWNPNSNGEVEVLLLDETNGGLFVGGAFSSIGGENKANLAKLDVNTGSAITTWTSNTDGPVKTLDIDGAGAFLYVGGEFTSPRNNIARVAAPSGAVNILFNYSINGRVDELVLNLGDQFLYIAGNFSGVNDGTNTEIRNGLAKISANPHSIDPWDPNPGTMGSVNAITFDDQGNVIVGGSFTVMSTLPYFRLAKIDPMSGTPDGSFIPNFNSTIHDLIYDPFTDNLLTCGSFAVINGQSLPQIAKMNMTTGQVDPDWGTSSVSGTPMLAMHLDQNVEQLFTGGNFKQINDAFRKGFLALGIVAEIEISQAGIPIADNGSFDFGNVNSVAPLSIDFDINSLGDYDLGLTAGTPKVVVSGADASDFSVDETNLSQGISPSTASTFTVTFTPGGLGVRNASIMIANTDFNENPYTIDLIGTGVEEQTMNFTALPNFPIYDDIIEMQASTVDGLGNPTGLLVTFSVVSGPATIVDQNNLSITGVGEITVRASQPGNSTYGAVQEDQVINSIKANQTITLTNGNITNQQFGTSFNTANLGATTDSSLPIEYRIIDNILLCADATTRASIVDRHIVYSDLGCVLLEIAQSGNDNYNATSTTRQFDVIQGDQTITFNDLLPKNVSDPDFDLTATASSGLPVTYTSSNTAVATISGNTVNILAEGNTNITASQGGNAFYNAASEVQNLVVNDKQGQTINFRPIVPAELSRSIGSFELTATASSGLPVTFRSDNENILTITGSTANLVGVGIVEITAIQAGNTNYNSAPPVAQTVEINDKQNQRITFDPLPTGISLSEGSLEISATASSGLPVSFFSTRQDVATVSGTTVTLRGVGTTTIVATQGGNSLFNPATNAGRNLVVNDKQSQTITFDPISEITFGDPDFDLSATASSGLAVTYESLNTDVATVSGNTVTIVSAGSADIRARQVGNTLYNPAEDVVRSLVVNKRDQTITFEAVGDRTILSGEFDISVGASSGLPVSLDVSDDQLISINGASVSLLATGTVNIKASQAGNTNYNAAAEVSRSFTINKEDQTITFATLDDKTLGDPDFDLVASATSGLLITFESSNADVATISGNTVTITGAGETFITALQAGNNNYQPAENVVQKLTVDPVTALSDDLSELGIRIYPNPVTSSLKIEGIDTGLYSFILTDLVGKKVKEFELSRSETIAMDKVKPGLYVLTVEGNNRVTQVRLIKN